MDVFFNSERMASTIRRGFSHASAARNSTSLKSKLCPLVSTACFYIRPQHKKNGIYRIKFEDCESVYIGQDGRTWKQRMDEHIRSVNNKGEKSRI